LKKLAIITSHPIQYNAPLFRQLHSSGRIQVRVFYTWGQSQKGDVYDPGFKRNRKWDIPLLEGYDHEFIRNVSPRPGSHHFLGIINPDLTGMIDSWQPDSILVIGWTFYSHLKAILYYRSKRKLFFLGDSTLLDETSQNLFRKKIRRMILKWVYGHIDFAFYVGKNNYDYYIQHGLTGKELIFMPHAVENDRFLDSSGELQKRAIVWRKELGIEDSHIVFLFCGKFESKKDPLILLNAFLRLDSATSWLLFVGNGMLEKSLKELAGDHPRVLFLPFQNQSVMPLVYRLGNIFVLPSIGPGETWGLSINEAMVCKRSVIVSDKCGAARDLVFSNGFVFKAGDMHDLLSCMKKFSEDNKLSELMGEESAKIIQKWDIDAAAKAIEQAI